MRKVFIVAYGENGYMVPVIDTVYKSKHGAKKARDKYVEKNKANQQYIKVLCADNWHEI